MPMEYRLIVLTFAHLSIDFNLLMRKTHRICVLNTICLPEQFSCAAAATTARRRRERGVKKKITLISIINR